MQTVTNCYMLICSVNDEIFVPFKIYHSLESAKKAGRKYSRLNPLKIYKVILWEGGIL